MKIGERIRSVRESLGHTQRQVAEAARMPSQYLSDLERGRNANPGLDILSRLAEAMDVGVDDLVGRGRAYKRDELPPGLHELLEDDEWAPRFTPAWVETLARLRHAGRALRTKEEFLEAYLTLRRIFPPA